MRREESLVIDKSYVPQLGDVLWNELHPLVVIQGIYALDKRSSRVNRSYDLQVLKHKALQKIITRKEIIWEQHRHDLRIFPERNRNNTTNNRTNITYMGYLLHNDMNQYIRLFRSKYSDMPPKRISVVTGKKPMVIVSHGLCKNRVASETFGTYAGYACRRWGGRNSQSVISLVNQGFKYLGNICTDLLQEESITVDILQ